MTTLLYDADCGFCTWCAAKVAAWDRAGRIRIVALQEPEAERLLETMEEQERMASWHLVTGDGRVRSAGEAFGPLLRALPGGAALARIAETAQPATNAAYLAVAGRRSSFGRLVSGDALRRADERLRRRLS